MRSCVIGWKCHWRAESRALNKDLRHVSVKRQVGFILGSAAAQCLCGSVDTAVDSRGTHELGH